MDSSKVKKSILLTGAAGGIGLCLANYLASEGFSILALDKHAKILDQPMIDNPNINWIIQDLVSISSSTEASQIFYESVKAILQGNSLYAIIHNAAVQCLGGFLDLGLDDWRSSLDVNLLAPVAINKLFMRDLIDSHGCIIHISSIHSHLTKPGFTAYATSKAALSGLTRAMAVELGDRVRVNAIEPAAIRTPMLETGFNDHPELLSVLEEHHPTKSIGSAEDVARAVSFLLDPANSFLNGCVLELGGGIHARLHDPA